MLKQLGEKLFRFYCHPDFQEDILGDLEEYFQANLSEKGEPYANRRFLMDAVLLFRFSLLRDNWLSQELLHTTMVKNNIKMAYRSMMRQKFYSMLNLTGLAISMAACVLIAVYVKHELSYDKFYRDSERIYRVATHIVFSGNEFNLPASPDPMAKTLAAEFPQIEKAGRLRGGGTQLMSYEEKYFRQDLITYADQEIFEIFSMPLLYGDREHLLDEPNTVVIDETVARKFFGDEDPVGKIIRHNDETDLKVTGVVAEIPDNSHFKFHVFISMLNRADARQNFWLSNNFITYVKLNSPEAAAQIEAQVPKFVKKHFAEQVKNIAGVDFDVAVNNGTVLEYYLQPLTSIHLYSHLDFELQPGGSLDYVIIFSIIGFFILLIACINFMNMATARASVRAKEVGVRKVLGSLRKQLIWQFLTESVLSSIVAFVAAIGLVYAVLPAFNQLTEKHLVDPVFGPGGLWPYLIVACLVVGILAGIYPAFVLSSYLPVKVLKGEVNKGRRAQWMRNALVIIQFTASIALVISSIIVYSQLNFLQNKDLGYDKDNVLFIDETHLLGDQAETYKNEILRNPYVDGVSLSGYIPSLDINNDFPVLRYDATSVDEAVSVQNWYVDEDYAKVYDLQLVDGRFLSKEFATDSSAVVINETAARRLGYLEGAVGQRIKTMGGVLDNASETYHIVGVVKDWNYKSVHVAIQPQLMHLRRLGSGMNVRFAANRSKEVLETAESAWAEMTGGKPFEYMFMDELFDDSLRQESRVKSIFTVFAGLALSIACLGLFGLAAYITEQRKKEIGIRKVLGASTFSLLNLIFSNFTKLVLISAVLASPLAWWYMNTWLEGFPFRINIGPLIFVMATMSTLVIALLTVGYQSLRAARRNPVDNLRYE